MLLYNMIENNLVTFRLYDNCLKYFRPFTVFNTSDWDIDTQWPDFPGEAVGNETQASCMYRGLNEPQLPYERKDSWWHVFAARLAFVLAFQVSIFLFIHRNIYSHFLFKM